MNNLFGRTLLVTVKPPESKSAAATSMAYLSPTVLLVICDRIKSFAPDLAKTSAGRRFDDAKSENGNGTTTTYWLKEARGRFPCFLVWAR